MDIIIAMVIYAVIAYLLVYFCHSNAGEDSSIPYASYGSYPIVGHLFHFLHDRTKFLMNCKQRYGRCFKIRLVNERLTFVLAPYDWATIIRNQSFYLPSLVNIIHMFGVSNTLLSHPEFDTEVHRQYVQYLRNRDGLRPLIGKFIRRLRDQMKNEKATLVNANITWQWTQCGLLEFSHRMIFQPLTFALFGEINPLSLDTDFRLFNDKIHYFGALLPAWMYSQFFTKALKARSRLNSAWLTKLHPSQESELSHARTTLIQDNYNWLSAQDHGALQTTLLWGSLGNTIPTVFWCLFYILQNAEALEVIKQEIDSHLPSFSLDSIEEDVVIEEWTMEKLNSCVYLESAINETLRFAASTFLTRKCRQETQIALEDGRILNVKPNETVAYFAPITHLDSNLFPDPYKFIFDRFVNKKVDNTPGFIPFGSGKSICPGRFFAKNDIKILFAMLLRYMEFKFIDTDITPGQKRGRVGFGVAPPNLDVPIMYRYKMEHVNSCQ